LGGTVKIYTRTGDAGETSLFGGTRARKSDPRVDAYGEVDELNAWLGLARASAPDPALADELVHLQRDLFALGAQLADPADKIAARVTKATLGDADTARLEQLIDRLDAELPPLRRFILAGGAPAGAALHVARTVCRRAERRIVALDPPVDPVLLRYVNRLSDLLFVLARTANHRAGVPEIEW
jgi:cob(I)alamin adenosyltransferase